MQKYQSFPTLDHDARNRPHDFSVVVAYEDVFSGEQAKLTLDGLLRRFEWRHNVTLTLWHFDVLKERALNEMAIRDAATAHMVVAVMDSQSVLTAGIKNWFEQWSQWKKKGEGMLVALFNDKQVSNQLQSPVRAYLERIALRTGMHFISQTLEFSQYDFIDQDDLFVDRFAKGAGDFETVMSLEVPGIRWGINE